MEVTTVYDSNVAFVNGSVPNTNEIPWDTHVLIMGAAKVNGPYGDMRIHLHSKVVHVPGERSKPACQHII